MARMFRGLIALGLLALLAAAPPVRVATIPFAELVRMSDIIVVGRVERVDEAGTLRGALVSVDDILKGDVSDGRLAFLASPTWTCDVTTAVVNERALLFLHVETEAESMDATWDTDAGVLARDRTVLATSLGVGRLLRVSHSGRGRMVVHEGSDDEHVHVFGDIKEAAGWQGDSSVCEWTRRRPLAEMRADVVRIVAEQRAAAAGHPR